MGAQPVRFRDPTSYYSLYNLARDPVHVVCPRCTAHARVLVAEAGDASPLVVPRRLQCTACGHTRTWPAQSSGSWWGAAVDPFFQQPLWLTTTVRGHLLWAYNGAHLALLTEFVTADLRERGSHGGCSMSLIERLPAWLKSSRNRADILAATARLRTRLTDPGHPVISRQRPPAPAPDRSRCGLSEAR